jgi:hypothetical protein
MQRGWLPGVARWTLTAVALAVLIAWVLSRWWWVYLESEGGYGVNVDNGAVWLMDKPTPGISYPKQPGFVYGRTDRGAGTAMVWSFFQSKGSGRAFIIVPIWWLALPAAASTVLAWRMPMRRALRRRRGACLACGYPRLGLASANPCPECGAAPAS